MIEIYVRDYAQNKWYRCSVENAEIYVRGYSYYQGQFYTGKKFCHLVLNLIQGDIENELRRMNGFFAFLIRTGSEIIAAVDHIRSMPLFYATEQQNVYVSDDVSWILENLQRKTINRESVTEFLSTGYVTGRDTLFDEIKQLQAGEFLVIKRDNNSLKRESKRYFTYRPSYGEGAIKVQKEELLRELEKTLNRVFTRLVSLLRGRTAVIPLSGGYDSRLIAMMLKKLGYENVICFSYGIKGNVESQISRMVAEKLGYKWLFVEYSNERWKKWYNSNAMRDYERFSSNFASLPHIQDWPAVMELKKNGDIPDDSVFLPGHTGDFIASGHIHWLTNTLGRIPKTNKQVMKGIFLVHYKLNKYDPQAYNIFKSKCRDIFHNCTAQSWTKFDSLGLYECWDWQERQSKFIVNSVRVYEFWNYDWLIPLWDKELVDFFQWLPFLYKRNKELYDEYVEMLASEFGISESKSFPSTSVTEPKKSGNIKIIAKRVMVKVLKRVMPITLWRILIKIKAYIVRCIYEEYYYAHPLAWFGMIERSELKKEYYVSINSYLTKQFIENLMNGVYYNSLREMR